MNYRGMMDGWHGDEPEIEYETQIRREVYEDAYADNWKYELCEEDE